MHPHTQLLWNYQLQCSMQQQQYIADKPRKYQQELFERAKREDITIFLGTGLGKTLISVLLVNYFSAPLRKTDFNHRKWSFFIVHKVAIIDVTGFQ